MMSRTARKANIPELVEYARLLRSACEEVKSAQTRALEYACQVGKIAIEIKKYLKTSTSLLTFKAFLATYCPELNQRSMNNYEHVYIQVNKDSNVCYPSISKALIDWRKEHPKKKRFQAMADKSKELIKSVPPVDKDGFPSEERVEPTGMHEWTAALPYQEGAMPGQVEPSKDWVFNGMQYHHVQKVWRDKLNGKWQFDTKVMALDHGQAVKVVGHQNDCTICRMDMVIDGNTVPLHFRVDDPSFPKLFDEVGVPKRLEGVSSAPPSILPDEVKTALGVLVAASLSLSGEQQKELRAWLVQFLELWVGEE